MTATELVIRPARPDDVDAIVAIHLAAFEGFVLTAFGPRFLRLLYEGFVTADDGICMAALVDDRVAGFVAGASEPGAFFSRLRKRKALSFVGAALPALARRPVLVGRRLFSAAFYRGDTAPAIADAALLSSIGVRPDLGRGGIGRALVDAFIQAARSRGCRSVYLTTDRDDNDVVNAFYRQHGFRVDAEFRKSGGRWMLRYRIHC